MSDEAFENIKKAIHQELEANKRNDSDVMYVSLDRLYWSRYETFQQLNEPPKSWEWDSKMNKWKIPSEFQVVLIDHAVIRYIPCMIDSFSRWAMFPAIHRPPRRYCKCRERPHAKAFDKFAGIKRHKSSSGEGGSRSLH